MSSPQGTILQFIDLFNEIQLTISLISLISLLFLKLNARKLQLPTAQGIIKDSAPTNVLQTKSFLDYN